VGCPKRCIFNTFPRNVLFNPLAPGTALPPCVSSFSSVFIRLVNSLIALEIRDASVSLVASLLLKWSRSFRTRWFMPKNSANKRTIFAVNNR
jgi:hypothetical protein